MTGSTTNVVAVEDRQALANMLPVDGQAAYLTEGVRRGHFVFRASDLSAKVAIDPAQGVYVPLANDPAGISGKSGAWVRSYDTLTTNMFGAVHDNVNDDIAPIQAAIDFLRDDSDGGKLFFSPGIAMTSLAPWVWDNIHICGQDNTSGLRNPGTAAGGAAVHGRAAFRTGNWVYNYWGSRDQDPDNKGDANSAPFEGVKISSYGVTSAFTKDQTVITLANPSEASNFTVGSIAYLFSDAHWYRVNLKAKADPTDPDEYVEIKIPSENTFSRVKAVNPQSGTVTLERPVGFDAVGRIGHITPGATDSAGAPIYIVQNVLIENLRVESTLNFHNAVGWYESEARNIRGKLRIVAGGNGYAYSRFSGFRGEFSERICEVKFCSHDSVIEDIHAYCSAPQDGGSPVSFGEGVRNITLRNWSVTAPTWDEGVFLNIVGARDCRVEDGKAFIPDAGYANATRLDGALPYIPIQLGRSGIFTSVNNVIDNLEITHFGTGVIACSGPDGDNPYTSSNCLISRVRSHSLNPSASYALSLVGGSDLRVSDSVFDQGGINFVGSSGAVVRDCVFGSATVAGSALANNRQYDNFKSVANGNDIPITPTPKVSQFIDLPALTAGATARLTLTVAGLATGDLVNVGYTSPETDIVIINAQVPAADTLVVTFMNVGASARDQGPKGITISKRHGI